MGATDSRGFLMMLGKTDGLKGRAARAGEPASALDPADLNQRTAVMPFRDGVTVTPG
jgi:hypothetical protein